jgi:hypothetical protein
MNHHDRAISRFRFRLACLLVLKYALAFLAGWGFLWGTVVLALRATLHLAPLSLLWGLTTLPLALVPAVFLALRRLPSRSAIRALLDQHSHCGGLLMAAEDVPLGQWREELPTLAAPRLRWRGAKAWGLLGGSVGFVLLSFLLPQGLANLGFDSRLEVDREVKRLKEQVDVLKEETVLQPQRAEDLKKKLDQLRREASGKEPVKTLEALDHVQEVVKKSASEAAESAAKKNEELARAETMADLLRKKKKGSKRDSKELAKAMKELATLTRKAADKADSLQRHLDKETLDALNDGTLDAEGLQKLADALRGHKGDLSRKLTKLHKAGLIDRETLERCEKCGKCDGEGLAAYLKEKGGDPTVIALCEKGGEGAPTRGPGEAPLTFKKESTEEGVKYKEQALPPAALAALKDSKISGISKGTPQIGKGGGPAGAGALAGSKAGGGSASTAIVLPRHRGVVERYFERPGEGKK